MYDASLDCRLRENALDRFRQAFEPVHAGDEDVFHAARGQFIEQLQIELRAFTLAEPQSEQFLAAFEIDPDCEVERLLDDSSFIAHFEEEGVEVEDRPDCFLSFLVNLNSLCHALPPQGDCYVAGAYIRE